MVDKKRLKNRWDMNFDGKLGLLIPDRGSESAFKWGCHSNACQKQVPLQMASGCLSMQLQAVSCTDAQHFYGRKVSTDFKLDTLFLFPLRPIQRCRQKFWIN